MQAFKEEPSFFKDCEFNLSFKELKENLNDLLQGKLNANDLLNAKEVAIRKDIIALFVLKEEIKKEALTKEQAIGFLKGVLFHSPSKITKAVFIKACVDYFELRDLAFFNIHSINLIIILQNDFFGVFGGSLYYDKWSFSFKKNFFGKEELKTPCKVALCVCGALRGRNWPTLLNKIIADLGFEVDVFLFAWDEEFTWAGLGGGTSLIYRRAYDNPTLKSKAVKEVATNAEFAKHFPKTYAKLNKEKSIPLSLDKIKLITNLKAFRLEKGEDFMKKYAITNPNPNVVKYYYAKNQVLKLLQNYEAQNKLKYDYIIQTRPDWPFKLNKDLKDFEKLAPQDILVETGVAGLTDALVVGPASSMSIMLSIWDLGNFNKANVAMFRSLPNAMGTHGLSFAFCSLAGLRVISSNPVPNWRGFSNDDWVLPNFDSELEEDIKASKLDKETLDKCREFFEAFKDLFKHKEGEPSNIVECLNLNKQDALNASKGELANALQTVERQYKALLTQFKQTQDEAAYKNYLSFKLGQALINAYKNLWRGDLLKFFFYEAFKIRKEHKDAIKRKKNLK